jgi:DNA phosphorothioation-associated putative methyltransferase
VPEADEFDSAETVTEKLGSLKRVFALIRRVTGTTEWKQIRQRRREDLLVYLALARFRKRPPISKLPRGLQRDIREFFGTYKRACQQADEVVFRAGEGATIDEACQRAAVRKLLPNAPPARNLLIVSRANREERAGFRKALGSLALMEAADVLNALRSDERLERWKQRKDMKLTI